MKYQVSGAHRDTGRDLTITLEAKSDADAREQAGAMGIMVADVRPEQAPVEVVQQTPIAALSDTAAPTYRPPSNYSPHVRVSQQRSNSLGITSLILAVVAFLFCWVPFVSVLSLPISGLALLLAVIAFLVSIARGGYGIGWSIGGGAVSGIAILVAMTTGIGAFNAMSEIAEEQQRRNQPRVLAEPSDDPAILQQQISDAKEELDRARKVVAELEANPPGTDLIDDFSVDAARVYWSDYSIIPSFEITVTNNLSQAVSKVYMEGVVHTPGRSIPWAKGGVNYEPPGGVEPGEQQTWNLQSYSDNWNGIPKDTEDVVFDLTVVRVDDAGGKPIIDISELQRTHDRKLADAREAMIEAEAQLIELENKPN